MTNNPHYLNLIAQIQHQLDRLKEEIEFDEKKRKAIELMKEQNKFIAENGG